MKDREFIEEILAHVSLAAAELPPEECQYADEENRTLYREVVFLMRICQEYAEGESDEYSDCKISINAHDLVEDIQDNLSDLRLGQAQGLLLGSATKSIPFDVAGVDVTPPDAVPDPTATKAARFNKGKPELSYVMSTGPALDGVARIMEFGAKKYARDNWKKGLEPDSILDSLLRHVAKYLNGEYLDLNKYGEADKDHSGLPHVDHIACNALFLGYHTNRHTGDGRLVDED